MAENKLEEEKPKEEGNEEKPDEKKGAENKEKKKQQTSLDSAVDESWSAIKGSANSAIGAGAIGGATALFGLDGLVTAASFPIGGRIVKKASGKEFTSGNFRDEAIAGALFTPPLWYGIETIKQVPKAFGIDDIITANILGQAVSISPTVAGLTFGVLTPALTALYYPLQYLVQNKTFKGLGEDFKKNYLKGLIRTSPLTAITSAAVGVTYATPFLAPYLFPALAVANILYRVLLSPEKISYKKLFYPSTYLPNFLNPFYLASGAATATYKVGKGVFEAASAIGSTLYEKIRNFFKAAAKPAPTPEPKPA